MFAEGSGLPYLPGSALVVTRGLWKAPVAVSYMVAVTTKTVLVEVSMPWLIV